MSIPFLKQDPLAHGAVEQTAPGVRRIVCPNPRPSPSAGPIATSSAAGRWR
ncbi:hypothetical protein ACFQY5_30125 [Paeniroseomonas aquatica]|uniref:hypothetical protein n=1 Tax=Paeniroseomonas aquatica TaxID=373043 RepID=UPI00360E5C93